MGHEVRRVPPGWEHPKFTEDNTPHPLCVGHTRPLLGDFAWALARWQEGEAKWPLVRSYPDGWKRHSGKIKSCAQYRSRPNPDNYMPVWPAEECTQLVMYETTTEGTPVSPQFSTPEELARWLADNKVPVFAHMTADYESWLRVARGGLAPSAIVGRDGTVVDGVTALTHGLERSGLSDPAAKEG
ncbi:MAG: hypothetical protein FWD68_13775 [Alphaproteobacteria bacterium]|nr:hypothetical protein [Alphaproteobacteria bacterium]